MKKLLSIIFVSLLFTENAYSGTITVDTYLKYMNSNSKEKKQHMNIVLVHIEQGFATANVELDYTKKDKIYCQPKKLSLNSGNLSKFLNDEIKLLKNDNHKIDDFLFK